MARRGSDAYGTVGTGSQTTTSSPFDRRGRLTNPDQTIGDWFEELTGRREGNQWGQDIDQRYAEAIRRTIGETEAAKRYRESLTRPEPTPTGGDSGGVFDDPATRDWESLLRQTATRLSTPRANPDWQPYVDYMRKYFNQLQQPGYTPAEQDIIQTQALDPMERTRQAMHDQVRQRYAQQGVTGGLVDRALQDVDRSFNQQRTGAMSNFATQQIQYDAGRKKDAATVGQALAQAQEAMASGDENRMMQAVSLLFQVPQYADQRLQLANQTLQPLNSQSLLAILNALNGQNAQSNANGNQQNQSFWGGIGQLLGFLF